MIRVPVGGGRFNDRVAGVAVRGGRGLVHRPTWEAFWTLPGGRTEMFGFAVDTRAGRCAGS